MSQIIVSFCIGFAFGYSGTTAILKKDLEHAVTAGALLIALALYILE